MIKGLSEDFLKSNRSYYLSNWGKHIADEYNMNFQRQEKDSEFSKIHQNVSR